MDAYLVGGYLRDSLAGVPSNDLDVVINGSPKELAKELADRVGSTYSTLDRDNQVYRVPLRSVKGSNCHVDIARLRGTVEDDLSRRDFTVDAIALPLEEWYSTEWWEKVIDPFDGRGDIRAKNVRALKPSVFQEDPIRLLRAVRLAARLSFKIEEETAQFISRYAALLSSASPENIRDEFLAILSLDGARKHLETLDRLGLLLELMPELESSRGIEQPKEHYWDVFEHSLNSVEAVEKMTGQSSLGRTIASMPWPNQMVDYIGQQVSDGHSRRTIIKLAALMHDVAKPMTKSIDSVGRIRFLGHQTIGSLMSRDILNRIRVSNNGIKMVSGMIKHHLRPTHMSKKGDLPTPRAIYRYFRDVGDVAVDTLYLSLADHIGAKGPQLDVDEWRSHVKMVTHILEIGTHQQKPSQTPRLITGYDLISEFGLVPGPYIGVLLEQTREAQLVGDVTTREGTLAWLKDRVRSQKL